MGTTQATWDERRATQANRRILGIVVIERIKGFRGKSPGEKDAIGFRATLKAELWSRFHREARNLNRAWEGCQNCPPERRDDNIPTEIHHVVSQQHLRAWAREHRLNPLQTLRLLTDPRNSMCVCDGCHHRHTNRSMRIRRSAIPAHAWEFASEHQLTAKVQDEYPADRPTSATPGARPKERDERGSGPVGMGPAG